MDSITFVVICLFVTIIAYFIKGVAAFGPSLIIVPVFALFMDIKDAVILAALADVLSSFILVVRGYKTIDWKSIRYVGLGLLVGTIIGVNLFVSLNGDVIRKLLGGFIIFYILLPILYRNIKHIRLPRVIGVVFGLIGGICGGIINTNGPMVVIYITSVAKNKALIRSSLAMLFFVDATWRVSLFTLHGLIHRDILNYFISSMVPALLVGMMLAFFYDRKFKNSTFNLIVRSILVVSGFNLLIF